MYVDFFRADDIFTNKRKKQNATCSKVLNKREVCKMSGEDKTEEFFRLNQPPPEHNEYKLKIEEFCRKHVKQGSMVALVTSGGTTVPLEHNTVRFVDNFSHGTRGSASAEYFLDRGYAVVFLYRHRSLQPFARHFTDNPLDLLRQVPHSSTKDDLSSASIEVIPEKVSSLLPLLRRYENVKASGTLLSIPFQSLVDYLWLLRVSAEALVPFQRTAVLYLAAAVSDFYIPQENMSTHKIHSDAAINISLHLVPKILQPLVRHWCPLAYVVSFKLETDEDLVIPKARNALANYGHQLVIANMLQSRRTTVIFVTKTSEETISLTSDELNKEIEIEDLIVRELIKRHKYFNDNNGEI